MLWVVRPPVGLPAGTPVRAVIRQFVWAIIVATVVSCSQGVGSTPTATGEPLSLNTASERASGCPTAALVPVEVAVAGDAIEFVSPGSTSAVDLEWPPGYRAELLGGVGVIESPSGAVIAREGDILGNLSGGLTPSGAFAVCAMGDKRL